VTSDRARFTPDGNTVYFSTTILGGDQSDPHSFLYALATHSDTTIDVELISFLASLDNKKVNLIWSTATETNNKGFFIERKFENSHWEQIGFVEGFGTTTEIKNYRFTDNLELYSYNGIISYRLKQVDYDGKYKYSHEVKIEADLIPYEFLLYQNYPNPFNPTTKITWQSPVGSMQTLKIYDVLGNEVATLVNEEKSAGYYEVAFDGSSLPSGIYFYRLTAGEFVQTKKMMLMK
jgi:hypothetical protein